MGPIKKLKDLRRERRAKGDELREWLQDSEIKGYITRPGQKIGSSGGHGVTQQMRRLPRGPVRAVLHDSRKEGTYVNPLRDAKRKPNRLRKELRPS